MMCGCWPRYWVTSSRARSMAVARSSSTEHTTSWGRSMSSSDCAGLGRAPLPGAPARVRLYDGRHQVVEHHPVGDLTGQLHHLHAGGADVDGHVLGPALLVHVVELDPVEVDELAVEGDRLVGQQRAAPRSRSPAWPAAGRARSTPTLRASGSHHAPMPRMIRPGRQVVEGGERGRQPGRVAGPAVDHAGPDLDPLAGGREGGHGDAALPHQPAVGLPHRVEAPLPRRSGRTPWRRAAGGRPAGTGRRVSPRLRPSRGAAHDVAAASTRRHSRANRRAACSAALARTSSGSTRVATPPASTFSPPTVTSSGPHAGREGDPPRVVRRGGGPTRPRRSAASGIRR